MRNFQIIWFMIFSANAQAHGVCALDKSDIAAEMATVDQRIAFRCSPENIRNPDFTKPDAIEKIFDDQEFMIDR